MFFQRMLRASSHSTGGVARVAPPLPVGPRHCGQYWEPSLAADARDAVRTARHNDAWARRARSIGYP